MGQKVHPKGMRLGVIQDWDAKWYADKDYAKLLYEDITIREYIKKRLYDAGIAKIETERFANRLKITIHTAKPGVVIGKGGTEVEQLRQDVAKKTGRQISLNIVEVKKTDINAQLVSENIAQQLEKRISFRRAIKQAVSRAMKQGAGGIKVAVAGRLGGAEIARTEWYSEGKVPLHTLRADVQYGTAEADTTYGKIGVKVWVYLGEILPENTRVAKEGK